MRIRGGSFTSLSPDQRVTLTSVLIRIRKRLLLAVTAVFTLVN
jgi:hypothetical protein